MGFNETNYSIQSQFYVVALNYVRVAFKKWTFFFFL